MMMHSDVDFSVLPIIPISYYNVMYIFFNKQKIVFELAATFFFV